jgi:FkbM family methyltransferase
MCIDYFDRESLQRWFDDKGDETHRINYDLNENSIVFDLGGYLGEWSEKIFNKYGCEIFIFEPVKKYYDEINNKFNNDKIKTFKLGLSDKDSNVDVYDDGAQSSVYLKSGQKENINLVDYNNFINKNNIEFIDLMKINIEGSEFDLLEYIIKNNLHLKIKNIQVQFHKMFSDSESRRDKIRKELSKTHKLTYDYKFVWENWQLL